MITAMHNSLQHQVLVVHGVNITFKCLPFHEWDKVLTTALCFLCCLKVPLITNTVLVGVKSTPVVDLHINLR